MGSFAGTLFTEPLRVALLRLLCRPLRETSQFCCHAQSPLGVGACSPNSLSTTAARFAPPALPGLIALTGQLRLPNALHRPSLFRLGIRLRRSLIAPVGISTVTARSSGQARLGLRSRAGRTASPCWAAPLSPASPVRLSALSHWTFRDYPTFTAAFAAVPPRLLSYLRIKSDVATTPARLNTGPVASSYPGGLPTRLNVRHCPCRFDRP